ncbi:glycoside hydrolase, partial [Candidatus Sumerlaeota bacterium]|nr:glycoside hydrolase [Candidatus Sumerlaeota bacterium]
MELLKEKFKQPETKYRSVAFWSWNDDLKPEELKRQIKLIKSGGWGGFFMHARLGLITRYLSSEWMECVRVCIEEAERSGLFAWLYDEYKWPSGFAGGIVPAQSEKFRLKALVLLQMKNAKSKIRNQETTLTTNPTCKEENLIGIEEKTNYKFLKAELHQGKELCFYVYTSPPGESWFNGTCYVDLLNPETVKEFIKCTHQAYASRFSAHFCGRVPGIFTDEPSISFFTLPSPSLPWTDEFPKRFMQENGYSILDHLTELFFDTGNFHKIRFDYWRTITHLFVESFTQQIYNWCEKNHLLLTGHFMKEDSILEQIQWIGSAMPHYEYMHQPGIDHLGRNIQGNLTAKQISSVAHQLGRERVLSEMFGCAGQNLSFKDRKWIVDWHFVHGINFVNPHLALYSMRGERKRDYPPNLFFQQPWWEYNKYLEDYIARLSYVLSQGERVVDILLLHPIGSGWSVYSPLSVRPVQELDESLNWVINE